ncbi:MAG: hypothetical protein AAF830_05875 [Pseudomonadota bacterium]
MANHYLGFDLGHADTAIALLGGGEQERFAAPANLEIQGQSIQPTALARINKDGETRILIGGRAIREASKASHDGSARLKAAFKTRPRDLGDARTDIRDFFTACLDEAEFDPIPPEGWAAVNVAVGCPSGWSANGDVDQYRDLLVEGLQGTSMADAHVDVVPESRAALLQAIDNPNSPLTLEARTENILVIDIGSSTLDFSLIAPEQKAAPLLDAGIDLGASFFDRCVLNGIIESEPAAKAFLQHNPHYRDLWIYYARRTKEQFFIDAPDADDEVITGAPLQTFFSDGTRRTLSIDVTGASFAQYRQLPYDRDLHPSPELNLDPVLLKTLSWEGIFEKALIALKDAIERRGSTYGRVLLAGGASRMPFTKEIAERVFARSNEQSDVLRDPEPSHMVSRGLARWGRKRENVEQFSKEAKRLLKDRLPPLIASRFDPLKERLSAGMASIVFDQFVMPVLEVWKTGEFKTGHDVREEIERRYRDWLRTDEGSTFFVDSINAWWRQDVKYELDQELDRLHTAYGISKDIQLSLSDAIDPDAFKFSTQMINLPFETIIQTTLVTLMYAVSIAIDATMGGIPFFTGALTAAVAVGGRATNRWIARLDVPAFARRLPDRMPGRERLFSGRIRNQVEKQLSDSLTSAKSALLDQIREAVEASVERQTFRARILLMGSERV